MRQTTPTQPAPARDEAEAIQATANATAQEVTLKLPPGAAVVNIQATVVLS